MFRAMAIGSIVHRTAVRDDFGGTTPTPQEVIDMATRTAARSVDAGEQIGQIKSGMKADLTILDSRNAALRPAIRIVSNIVHYAHPGTVEGVIVDGEWVMRDRKILTVDEDALLAEAQAVTRSVWGRLIEQAPDIEPPAGELQWPVLN
jgi:5-methylthioadenosine/S-adenosylhomocysteine deaminase